MKNAKAVLLSIVIATICVACAVLVTTQPCTITYETNGGTVTDAPTQFAPGDVVDVPDAHRDGYRFDGWFTDSAFSKKFTGDTKGITGDLTLYAKWSLIHSIMYELDGGTIGPNSPTTFCTGDVLTIPAPSKTDMIFNGWYLDRTLQIPFSGNTTNLDRNLTLYAAWGMDLSGHTVTLSKEGKVERGYNSYELAGELTFRYLYYDATKSSYFIENYDVSTYYYEIGTSYTEAKSSMYWSSEVDAKRELVGVETIPTVAGDKECYVIRLTYSTGMTETQWIGDVWIPYKILVEYKSEGIYTTYSTHIEYLYMSDSYEKIETECTISICEGKGVTTFGSGTYGLGQVATLTAVPEDGTVFSGWYDSGFNLLSTSETYKMVVGGSQTIFALNTNTVDTEFKAGKECNLNLDGDMEDAVYAISNTDTLDSEISETSTYTFKNGGMYTVIAKSETEFRYYTVKVTGTAERVFNWTYNGTGYNIILNIDYDDLLYTRSYYSPDQRMQDILHDHARDKTFVSLSTTDEHMVPYTQSLVSQMTTITKSMTDIQKLECILKFVQTIEYESDEECMGYDEYWKFPLETLYDCGGDCEDTSILFCLIASQMGYESSYILLPSHMAAGVIAEGVPTFNDKTAYSYCETTSTGFSLGDIPGPMKEFVKDENAYTVVEIPISQKQSEDD